MNPYFSRSESPGLSGSGWQSTGLKAEDDNRRQFVAGRVARECDKVPGRLGGMLSG